MTAIYAFVLMSICFSVFVLTRWIWHLNRARRKGLIPTNEKLTMFHVRQMIVEGEKDLAVRAYCDIFKVSKAQAYEAVDELERSIKEKNL